MRTKMAAFINRVKLPIKLTTTRDQETNPFIQTTIEIPKVANCTFLNLYITTQKKTSVQKIHGWS